MARCSVNSNGAVKEPVKTLLLGMGNPILCDDAVGIRLARYIAPRVSHIPGLTVIEECSAGGLNILDIVAGYDRMIILDSIKTHGGNPGDWYHFTAQRLRETMNINNVHDTNLATALELGRRLGLKIPADHLISIFAVEVSDNVTFSERMTTELESTFHRYAEEICLEILKS